MGRNVNNFICNECKGKPMTQKNFMDHLREVHKLDPDKLKGHSKRLMHMDGKDWYSSEYLWTLESGLTFNQYCRNQRSKNDPMRYN